MNLNTSSSPNSGRSTQPTFQFLPQFSVADFWNAGTAACALRQPDCEGLLIPNADVEAERAGLDAFGQSLAKAPPFLESFRGSRSAASDWLREAIFPRIRSPEDMTWGEVYVQAVERRLALADELSGSGILRVVVRNCYWEPDAVWHIDAYYGQRMLTRAPEFRMLWALGRNHGTVFTPWSNFNMSALDQLLERVGSNLAVLQLEAIRTGNPHPGQVVAENPIFSALLATQDSYFLYNPTLRFQAPADWMAVHWIRGFSGRTLATPHRSDIRNREQPGLQTLISANVS